MPSDASTARTRHVIGPIYVINTPSPASYSGSFSDSSRSALSTGRPTPLSSHVLYTAIAGFILYNALYVGGVRLR
ncbi:hypothetical protein ACFFQF_11455 [Haladaptatus pallidirubidus]|uniref:hypothetical protein n=1 Tax=Haladaptatus pallidirubidus TaxID=1008152 RepID=UPI0035E73904